MSTVADAFVVPPPLSPRRAACRPPGLGEALGLLVVYFGLQFLVAVVVGTLAGLAMGVRVGLSHAGISGRHLYGLVQKAMANPDVRTSVTAVALIVTAAVTLWLVRRRWPRQWVEPLAACGFGFVRPSRARFYVLAILLGLATPVLGGLLTQWLAQGHPVPQDINRMGHTASMGGRLALAFAAVTLGPLVEETLFRGVLLSALLGFRRGEAAVDSRRRTVVAVGLSAALFGVVHLPDLAYLWYAVPNLALLGVAAAWLRLRSGSLWPAVVAHGANNLLAVAGWFIVAHPAL